VTFYGGIALAAIAADKVNAYNNEEIETDELAQSLGAEIESTDAVYTQASSEAEADSTNLASIESEGQSEGELEAWSDAESDSASESGSEGELDNMSESMSENDSDFDEDCELVQVDADAEAERCCPCRRAWFRRRRQRIFAWRRRMAILRARRAARIRGAQARRRRIMIARRNAILRARRAAHARRMAWLRRVRA
jgi:hypothetical protein